MHTSKPGYENTFMKWLAMSTVFSSATWLHKAIPANRRGKKLHQGTIKENSFFYF